LHRFYDPEIGVKFVAADDEDFVILARSVMIQSYSVTDGQRDRQAPRRQLKRAKHYMLSRVKKIHVPF